jgi:hypothetical protein
MVKVIVIRGLLGGKICRKNIGKPATDRAQELILHKLAKYDVQTAIAMLEQSVVSSWSGVFELKKENKNGTDRINTRKGEYAGVETEIRV